MCSSFRPQDIYDTFDEFEKAWHRNFKHHNPNWRNSMYMDGQFDEFPFIEWEENKLIDEFNWYGDIVIENNGSLSTETTT